MPTVDAADAADDTRGGAALQHRRGALERGKPVLHSRAEDVAAEAAIAPPHPVARQDERHRIAAERGAHRPHRAGVADARGDPRVGAALAERDVPGPLQTAALDVGTPR